MSLIQNLRECKLQERRSLLGPTRRGVVADVSIERVTDDLQVYGASTFEVGVQARARVQVSNDEPVVPALDMARRYLADIVYGDIHRAIREIWPIINDLRGLSHAREQWDLLEELQRRLNTIVRDTTP